MTLEEVWKPVPILEFEHRYEVSSFGRIRNTQTKHVLIPMRTGVKRPGSQRSKIRFCSAPRKDYDIAHLVLVAFVRGAVAGEQAMHLDDDSTNNHVNNLKWGTNSENMRDMINKKRGGNQKVSLETATEIARRRLAGERGVVLAEEFGISSQRVCDFYKGRTLASETILGAAK